MKLNVWGYLKEYEQYKGEILKAVEEVMESGRLILGPKVEAFEQCYAEYIGTSYGIGCDNGTNALFLALKSLGIGKGDEVITVANTAIPTVSAIVSTGATPVLVDIDKDTYLMNVTLLEEAISTRTKAIIPVHLYGQCVDMDTVLTVAEKHGIKVVEDCAQAHGAEYKGRKAGSMGTIGATSFYPTKVLGAYGDGGMINTSDEQLAAHLKRLRFYGTNGAYYAEEHGYNSRLDEMQAAILLTKMKHLEAFIARRREIAEIYNRELADTSLILPKEVTGGRHVYYLYVARHKERQRVLEEMKKRDVNLNVSYPWPIHQMPAYADCIRVNGELKVTEEMAQEIFSLPMYPSMTNEEVLYVCNQLKDILNKI